MLSQDAFYRGLTPEESANAAGMLEDCQGGWMGYRPGCVNACLFCPHCAEFDFDSPSAFDEEAIVACLHGLKVNAG